MAKPTFGFEKPLWKKNYLVIGVDEVGRGAIAGPVVASAVAFAINPEQRTKNLEHIGIDDSKRLTAKRREELARKIKKGALAYGIGEVGAGIIDKVGISKATAMALRRAIRLTSLNFVRDRQGKLKTNNPKQKTFILLDGYQVKYLPGGLKKQKAIVRGDQKSISIAAASIIAKVYRDDKMRLLDKKYPQYAFERHKGYGTKKHREVIMQFGSTYHHRERFLTTFLHLD